MIEPDRLADRLQDCAVKLRCEGGLAGERFSAWTKAAMPRLFESDDDAQEAAEVAGRTERDEADRRGDALAAAYWSEWQALLRRLESDTARAVRLMMFGARWTAIFTGSMMMPPASASVSGEKLNSISASFPLMMQLAKGQSLRTRIGNQASGNSSWKVSTMASRHACSIRSWAE